MLLNVGGHRGPAVLSRDAVERAVAGDEDAGLLGAVRCLEKGAAVQEIDGKQKAKLLTIFMNMTRSRKYNEQPTFVA